MTGTMLPLLLILFSVAPDICGSSSWNLFQVTFWIRVVTPRILENLCALSAVAPQVFLSRSFVVDI